MKVLTDVWLAAKVAATVGSTAPAGFGLATRGARRRAHWGSERKGWVVEPEQLRFQFPDPGPRKGLFWVVD